MIKRMKHTKYSKEKLNMKDSHIRNSLKDEYRKVLFIIKTLLCNNISENSILKNSLGEEKKLKNEKNKNYIENKNDIENIIESGKKSEKENRNSIYGKPLNSPTRNFIYDSDLKAIIDEEVSIDDNSFCNKEMDNEYNDLISKIFSGSINNDKLENLEYGLEGILEREYLIEDRQLSNDNICFISPNGCTPRRRTISVKFLKFLIIFSSNCDKTISLFQNFKKYFDEFTIKNHNLYIEEFYNFIFLSNEQIFFSFYEISLFYSFIWSKFPTNKFINALSDKIFQIYLIQILNKYRSSIPLGNISDTEFDKIFIFFKSRFNGINGLIYKNFIDKESIDKIIYLFIIIKMKEDKMIYLNKYSSSVWLYFIIIYITNNPCVSCDDNNKAFLAKKNLEDNPPYTLHKTNLLNEKNLKLEIFIRKNLSWPFKYKNETINIALSKTHLKYGYNVFVNDLQNVFGIILKEKMSFLYPQYKLINVLSGRNKTKNYSHTHLYGSKMSIYPYTPRNSLDRLELLNGESQMDTIASSNTTSNATHMNCNEEFQSSNNNNNLVNNSNSTIIKHNEYETDSNLMDDPPKSKRKLSFHD